MTPTRRTVDELAAVPQHCGWQMHAGQFWEATFKFESKFFINPVQGHHLPLQIPNRPTKICMPSNHTPGNISIRQ
jgi:hypothetical protein